MIDTLVQVPAGWLVAESPPEGIALAAIDPAGDGPLRTNLVVTMVDRPAVNDVERYLDSVLANLLTELDDARLVDAWTTDNRRGQPPTLGQRILVHHRVGAELVAVVQQHTWIDDTIVVVTVTSPIDLADDLVVVLSSCLESIAIAA